MRQTFLITVFCLLMAAMIQNPTANAENWSALGSGANGWVQALEVWNGQLIAGGLFTSPGSHISSWNGSAWTALGSGMNGTVLSFASFNGQLIAGGPFTASGSTSLGRIAAWNGSSWSPLGSGVSGTNAAVYALCTFQDLLIAGGIFTQAGATTVSNIASWNGTSWSALGSGTGGSSPNVYALVSYDNQLIAGGNFSSPGSQIAAWNGSSWSQLGTGLNGEVRALTTYDGKLIAGGTFTSASGVPANRIAAWNGSSWASLGLGMNGIVQSLAVRDGYLYAGGEFTTAGGTAASHVARWDGTSWTALGSGTNGTVVWALTDFGLSLVAGGSFTLAGSISASNIASWHEEAPCKFGYAVRFQQAGDSIRIPLSALNNMPQGTVEAWVKFNSLTTTATWPGEQFIITRSKYASTWVGDLRLGKEQASGSNANKFYFSLNNGTDRLYSTTVATANTWYHVAGTWDGANWRIYVNGNLEQTLPKPGSVLTNDPAMNVLSGAIGGSSSGNRTWVNGWIDELRVSDVARTSSGFCLTSECASGTNTVALWHFNESTGGTAYDAAGNNYNGSIYGATHEVCVANQPPAAFIDEISPNPALVGASISFSGHGFDSDGDVVAYKWESDIDGQLSALATFSIATLSVGTHGISFQVQDNEGIWSGKVLASLIVRQRFIVAANRIRDLNDNSDFDIRGVNVPSLEWGTSVAYPYTTQHLLDLIQGDWMANTIRLPLNQEYWLSQQQYRQTVNEVVTTATQRGIIVILDLHTTYITPPNPNRAIYRLPNTDADDFWAQVAGQYKNNGFVFFELYNEPHEVSWDQWRNGGYLPAYVDPQHPNDWEPEYYALGMQSLVDAIRGTAGAQNLIIVDGLSWGYDISHVLDVGIQLIGNNIAYATHPYAFSAGKDCGNWDSAFLGIARRVPVIATEFGTDDCSIDYVGKFLHYALKNHIGFTAWAWFWKDSWIPDTDSACKFPTIISNWDGAPSAMGLPIREVMRNFGNYDYNLLPSCSGLWDWDLVFSKFSPVDLEITDPDGLVIGRNVVQVPGATYEVYEIVPGDSGAVVRIPFPKSGLYHISVEPLIGADPDATYTILASMRGDTVWIAVDTPVSTIPADGYFFSAACGDADGSGTVTISDAVRLINYIFSGGPAPDPLLSGDADCSGAVTISDAVYLINFIFGGGAVPCAACP